MIPVGIQYLSIRESLIQEKRGMHDGQSKVPSDGIYMELDKVCAELAEVMATVRDGADRMEVVYRGV